MQTGNTALAPAPCRVFSRHYANIQSAAPFRQCLGRLCQCVCAYANSCLAYSPTTENTRDRVQTNVWPIRPPLCRPDRFEQKIFSELNAGIIDKNLPDVVAQRSRLQRPGPARPDITNPNRPRTALRSLSHPLDIDADVAVVVGEKVFKREMMRYDKSEAQ